MFELLRGDMRRYKEVMGFWFFNQGFWILQTYRFGHWAGKIRPKIAGIPFKLISRFFIIPVRLFYCVQIENKVEIGPGLVMEHPWMIFIGQESKIGSNCTIYHDVTLGKGPKKGDPILSDNVVVFPGARILGGVTIGEHCHIGANAVVTKHLNPWTMVVPPESKQIGEALTKRLLGIKDPGIG